MQKAVGGRCAPTVDMQPVVAMHRDEVVWSGVAGSVSVEKHGSGPAAMATGGAWVRRATTNRDRVDSAVGKRMVAALVAP
jgi:hypothetical protein